MARYQTLRLILGDQLNSQHSWFRETRTDVLYVIAELRQETDYVCHHVQKVCAFFAAMAAFADQLRESGHRVLHLDLDETEQWRDLPDLINGLINKYQVAHFEYQRPDEYRLLTQLRSLKFPGQPAPREYDSEHFLVPFEELKDQFPSGRHVRMETFYRRMRQRFNVLMDADKPRGGRWNFDAENRQRLQPEDIEALPEALCFENDVTAILGRLKRHRVESFGTAHEQLLWPVNRDQALALMDHFMQHCLPAFGRFQDAMTGHGESRWTLYHSRLSFALNVKLLAPAEVIEAASRRFHDAGNEVDIAQAEGFIRQILGWREYVRGIYWANIPAYRDSNVLAAKQALPDWFWSGETKMKCLQQAIVQSLETAYAHHIQRLMVTGNFCLLAGIDPDQVEQWYLGIYVDALEWVEMPNTRGMSQYADGGLIATKPYCASGNYVNRMSDYCDDCHYRVKEKTGPGSCPLNSLYWHFMTRHRDRFAHNQRTGMIYRNWDRMATDRRQAVLDRADWVLTNLDRL
ncbi:MAG: cryptochrome/photolyase family protein [Pseudomonadales bacterium]|nr:cryptochrome/photolyase family protein [Pseudomonadales bacterium]